MLARETRTKVPPLSHILEDLNYPDAAEVAKFLNVHPATVHRWIREDRAPKTARLALYWLTPYARATIYHDEEHRAALHAGLVRALQEELQALKKEMARVLALADFGCANDVTLLVQPSRISACA